MERQFSRGAVLKIGGAGLAAAFAPRALDLLSTDADASIGATNACLLTRETTEGPYWVDFARTRRDIREGKAGSPLVVRFTVLNARTCKAIPNADVEIWHCDARGAYSAVNGAPSRFLRGHQKTNAAGKAEFLTIFPGWYPGRTPHIHMKVYVGGDAVHTGQVFFSEAVTRAVYRQAPYRIASYTTHGQDGIYADAGGSVAELKLARRTGGVKGYVGTIAVGVVP